MPRAIFLYKGDKKSLSLKERHNVIFKNCTRRLKTYTFNLEITIYSLTLLPISCLRWDGPRRVSK